MIILTVKSTGGIPIRAVQPSVLREMGAWERKGKDNGLLFLIAIDDRRYRFETGYGLEQTLPDSMLGSIGRSYLVPAFKEGAYTKGVVNTASVIAGTIAASQGAKLSGLPEVKPPDKPRGTPFGSLLAFIFFAIAFFSLSRSRSGGLAQASSWARSSAEGVEVAPVDSEVLAVEDSAHSGEGEAAALAAGDHPGDGEMISSLARLH
jgi:uncharacterized membrane protein YgcG